MKNYFKLLVFALIAATVGSCSESEGTGPVVPPVDNDKITLEASKTTITADGTDKVTFSVKKGDTDVSNDAEFFSIAEDGTETKMEVASFTTKKDGTYTFKAKYDTKSTNTVKITASGEVMAEEKYYRNVAVFKLTGTWCSFCPDAGRQIADMAKRNYPDRIIEMAFHGGQSDEPMLVPETKVIEDMFKRVIQGSYPACVVDMRSPSINSGTVSLIGVARDAVKASLGKYTATCGIRLDSKASNGKLDITVGVTSNTGGNYRVAVYVIENNLIYKQLDASLWVDNFQHNHVVRKLLSKTVMGDSLGNLTADQEKTLPYSIDLNSNWKVENLKIVAYVLDDTNTINNIAECEANNGKIDYRLNK